MNPPLRTGHPTDRLLPCGTDTARRRHLAKGQCCPACGVNVDGPPDTLLTSAEPAA